MYRQNFSLYRFSHIHIDRLCEKYRIIISKEQTTVQLEYLKRNTLAYKFKQDCTQRSPRKKILSDAWQKLGWLNPATAPGVCQALRGKNTSHERRIFSNLYFYAHFWRCSIFQDLLGSACATSSVALLVFKFYRFPPRTLPGPR